MQFAITLARLSTLCQRTIGRFFPINVDRLPNILNQPIVAAADDCVSCPTNPPLPTAERTVFGTEGCVVYGYPSTGGVLRKEADFVDMLFLSLPRTHASQRAPDADEEDRFCKLLRRTGATWWPSREDWVEVQMGMREMTAAEEKVLVFGWPVDGVGVWVLRFASASQMPRDFGRLRLAMDMEERIEVMKEYGAIFVEDVAQVEEFRDN